MKGSHERQPFWIGLLAEGTLDKENTIDVRCTIKGLSFWWPASSQEVH